MLTSGPQNGRPRTERKRGATMNTPVVARSPYLTGSYTPVTREIDAPKLAIKGELPRDLEGMYVRNSSNPRFEAKGRYHWFDGDGMIHGVQIADGQANYKNRWVRTSAFLAEEAAGEAL